MIFKHNSSEECHDRIEILWIRDRREFCSPDIRSANRYPRFFCRVIHPVSPLPVPGTDFPAGHNSGGWVRVAVNIFGLLPIGKVYEMSVCFWKINVIQGIYQGRLFPPWHLFFVRGNWIPYKDFMVLPYTFFVLFSWRWIFVQGLHVLPGLHAGFSRL